MRLLWADFKALTEIYASQSTLVNDGLAFSVDAQLLVMVGTFRVRDYMRALFVCAGIIGSVFSPCVACGQDANDPGKLRVDIARRESEAVASLERGAENLAESAENAVKQEIKKDARELQLLRSNGAAVGTSTAVPTLSGATLDDSDASIARDISSLEAQERSLDTVKSLDAVK